MVKFWIKLGQSTATIAFALTCYMYSRKLKQPLGLLSKLILVLMPAQLTISMLLSVANEIDVSNKDPGREQQSDFWYNKLWSWVDYFVFSVSNIYAIYAVMRFARVQVQLRPKVFETQYVLREI